MESEQSQGLSTGWKVALGVALVWAALWGMGAVLFWRAATDQGAEAVYLSQPLTAVAPGTDVRLEGTVLPGATVPSPMSGSPCLAGGLSIAYVTTYLDANNRTQYDSSIVGTRRVGPESVLIEAGGARVALPLANFWPDTRYWPTDKSTAPQLDPKYAVPPGEIARAQAATGGHSGARFWGFELHEWTMRGGMPVFVAGHLGAPDTATGVASLGANGVLGKLVVVPGTQRAFVERLRSSSSGLRVASGVFVGLAALPLLIVSALAIRSVARRRPRAA